MLSRSVGTTRAIDTALLQETETSAKPAKPLLCDGEAIGAILALVNAALGAGVLAYPYAFMSAGIVPASIFTAAIGTLSLGSLFIIMHAMAVMQKRHGEGVTSFGDLVRCALGPRASVALEVLIVVYMFGACVGYLEVLDNIADGVVSAKQLERLGLSRTDGDMLILIVASVPCYMLATLRSIAALRYSAAASVLAVLFTVGTLIVQAATDPCRPATTNDTDACDDETSPVHHGWDPSQSGVSLWPVSVSGLIKSLPLIAFAMQCHIQCAAAFNEMPDRLKHSVGRRRGVAIGATLLTLLLYFPAGIAGFVRFGDATNGDILVNWSSSDMAANAARVCMALTALAAFPCQHYPARTILHKVWHLHVLPALCAPPSAVVIASQPPSDGWASASTNAVAASRPLAPPEISRAFALIEGFVWTAVVCAATIGATASGFHLDKVFALIGSICGSAVILIIPGALWARLGTGAKFSCTRLLPALVLGAVGLFILCAGTAVTILELAAGNPSPPPAPAAA